MKHLVIVFMFVIAFTPLRAYSYDNNGNIIVSPQTQTIVDTLNRQHFIFYLGLDKKRTHFANANRFYKYGDWSLEWFYSTDRIGISIERKIAILGDLGIVLTSDWRYKNLDQEFGIGLRFLRFKF